MSHVWGWVCMTDNLHVGKPQQVGVHKRLNRRQRVAVVGSALLSARSARTCSSERSGPCRAKIQNRRRFHKRKSLTRDARHREAARFHVEQTFTGSGAHVTFREDCEIRRGIAKFEAESDEVLKYPICHQGKDTGRNACPPRRICSAMALDHPLTRKEVLTTMLVAAAASAFPAGLSQASAPTTANEITLDDLKSMEKIAGISFTDAERKRVLAAVREAKTGFDAVRKQPITATIGPSTPFLPLGGTSIPGSKVRARHSDPSISRPSKDEDLAFLSVRELAHLVRTQQVSPVELTDLYLGRLKRYGDRLLSVVTLTEDLARSQAAVAEQEIKAGKYRGPLHGIPYGIKDLFSAKGLPTTWGAGPYEHQVFDYDATVVRKLQDAGAILLAKLSCGSLAQGDVWFKGTTKNPWNPKQGSSGSSAGSASCTAAGLVAFSIGTETYGSITSPSVRCRVTGFRPTFGRVSRYGAMELSYSMDKVGPICREVEDCALVFAAICGADLGDLATVDRPFSYPRRTSFKNLKVGWVGSETAMATDPVVKLLKDAGASVKLV